MFRLEIWINGIIKKYIVTKQHQNEGNGDIYIGNIDNEKIVAKVPVNRSELKIEIDVLNKLEAKYGYYFPNVKYVGKIIDVDKCKSKDCIVMKYYGESLKNFIKNLGRYNFKTVNELGILMLENLEKIHALNILHMDLKPQNILIENELNS